MSKPPSPSEFRKWIAEAPADAERHYTSEAVRDDELMEIARIAQQQGKVALFRLRLNGELWMTARILSGAGRRFLKAAPNIGKRRLYKDPRTYVPFTNPSGRGLNQPTIPDGFDGPASRRHAPIQGGPSYGDD